MLSLTKMKLNGKSLKTLTLGFFLAVVLSPEALATSTASATANSVCAVLSSISIVKTRDLQFGNSAPGDASKVVLASDASNSATFTVSGSNSATYSIGLPADGTVTMITGAGATANEQISVNTFTSLPTATGTLSATGSQTLTVGATRAAILSTQTAGSYSGSFTVTVTYQ